MDDPVIRRGQGIALYWPFPFAVTMFSGAWLAPVVPDLDTPVWDTLFITAGVTLLAVLLRPRSQRTRQVALFLTCVACFCRAIDNVITRPTPSYTSAAVWFTIAFAVFALMATSGMLLKLGDGMRHDVD